MQVQGRGSRGVRAAVSLLGLTALLGTAACTAATEDADRTKTIATTVAPVTEPGPSIVPGPIEDDVDTTIAAPAPGDGSQDLATRCRSFTDGLKALESKVGPWDLDEATGNPPDAFLPQSTVISTVDPAGFLTSAPFNDGPRVNSTLMAQGFDAAYVVTYQDPPAEREATVIGLPGPAEAAVAAKAIIEDLCAISGEAYAQGDGAGVSLVHFFGTVYSVSAVHDSVILLTLTVPDESTAERLTRLDDWRLSIYHGLEVQGL